MTETPFQIEKLIGQTVMVNPHALLNRKRLYTTQGGIDMKKLMNAMNGIPDIYDDPPKGWVSLEKHGLIYTAGDGNHRLGLACIEGGEIPFFVKGIWTIGLRFGFNLIVSKINSELRGSMG
ncbi:conserved hypothetical protein [Candidatus Roizmanbacteria bacterium]|nr:conserved hypothetical protein [Candidatus Roizmanbacteria bacterium]